MYVGNGYLLAPRVFGLPNWLQEIVEKSGAALIFCVYIIHKHLDGRNFRDLLQVQIIAY